MYTCLEAHTHTNTHTHTDEGTDKSSENSSSSNTAAAHAAAEVQQRLAAAGKWEPFQALAAAMAARLGNGVVEAATVHATWMMQVRGHWRVPNERRLARISGNSQAS